MQERYPIQHRFPLRHIGDVEELLGDICVGSLEPGLDAQRRLVGELDGGLQQGNGELGVAFSGDPHSERLVNVLCVV